MKKSVRAHSQAVTLLLLGAMLLVPAVALANGTARTPLTGGGGLGAGASSSSTSSPTSSSSSSVQPANQSVQASGNGITIVTSSSAVLRNQLRFSGTVSGAAGQTVEVERRGRETGWTWAPTTHGVVQRGGSWSAVWPVNHIGRFAIRAVLVRGRVSARSAAGTPTVTITVFRPSIATQYGPGFYGSRTACGQILRPTTIGVANRTLKCGTPVAILWHGHTMVVPVIDRGPYANHADWDLTTAAAQAMGISGTATIGAVSLPSR